MVALDLDSLKLLDVRVADPEIVRKCSALPIFEGMSEESVVAALGGAEIRRVPAGNTLVLEGDPSNGEAYVVLSGKVSVHIGGARITELAAGAIFGEYALISDDCRTATVRTEEDSELLVLTQDGCLEIANGNNLVNEIMMDRIERNMDRKLGVFAEVPGGGKKKGWF